jgi:hypothetical protein
MPVTLKIPLLPLLSNFHILPWRFLGFLLESVQEDHAVALSGRAEDAVDIAAVFSTCLPKVVSSELFPEF